MKKVSLLSVGLLILATGCSKSVTSNGQSATPNSSSATTTSDGGTSGSSSSSTTNNTQIVCNPMSQDPTIPGPTSGLVGTLHYYDPALNEPNPANVGQILANGTLSPASIFMSELNVPTHTFSEGFTTTGGTELTTPSGTDLVENFALSFDSQLRLSEYDQPGLKQFALLSDDGANFYLDQGNGLKQVVNDDGGHPTEMSCASSAIWMGHDISYPIHVDYFQGPRYEIALMLLWRNIPDEFGTGEQDSPILDPSSLNETMCHGQNGDTLFFNPATIPSTPSSVWDQLRADGWEVVPAVNFVLPGEQPNPCASPTGN
jgi:hypothetical protein